MKKTGICASTCVQAEATPVAQRSTQMKGAIIYLPGIMANNYSSRSRKRTNYSELRHLAAGDLGEDSGEPRHLKSVFQGRSDLDHHPGELPDLQLVRL